MTSTATGRAMQRAQARPPRAHEWTEEKRAHFLETLARTLNVSASARAVKMSTVSAHALKRRDAAFAQAWGEAMTAAYQDLELALIRRATRGTLRKVWHQGKKVGSERIHDERLAMQLMSQHRDTVLALRGLRMPELESEEEIRARLIARFELIEARLTGNGDAG